MNKFHSILAVAVFSAGCRGGNTDYSEFSLSPSGSYLIYAHGQDDSAELHRKDLPRGPDKLLLSVKYALRPALEPASSRILYSDLIDASSSPARFGIFIFDTISGSRVNLSNPPAGCSDYRPAVVGGRVYFDRASGSRAYSLGGRVFSSDALMSMRLDGTGQKEMARGYEALYLAQCGVRQEQLFFVANHKICRLDAPGGKISALYPATEVYDVAASPKGSQLAFLTRDQEIHLADSSGRGPISKLTSLNSDIADIAFSPDGKSIVFCARSGWSGPFYFERLDLPTMQITRLFKEGD